MHITKGGDLMGVIPYIITISRIYCKECKNPSSLLTIKQSSTNRRIKRWCTYCKKEQYYCRENTLDAYEDFIFKITKDMNSMFKIKKERR